MKNSYQYSVLKYIDDQIRDEPVNVGILVISREENKIYFASILKKYEFLNCSPESKIILNGVLSKLENDLEHLNPTEENLQSIRDKFDGKIILTPLLGILYENPEQAVSHLFRRYIADGNFAIRVKTTEEETATVKTFPEVDLVTLASLVEEGLPFTGLTEIAWRPIRLTEEQKGQTTSLFSRLMRPYRLKKGKKHKIEPPLTAPVKTRARLITR
jgi:Protein of unknown function (DUF3037)